MVHPDEISLQVHSANRGMDLLILLLPQKQPVGLAYVHSDQGNSQAISIKWLGQQEGSRWPQKEVEQTAEAL